jgi:hypothetical protein
MVAMLISILECLAFVALIIAVAMTSMVLVVKGKLIFGLTLLSLGFSLFIISIFGHWSRSAFLDYRYWLCGFTPPFGYFAWIEAKKKYNSLIDQWHLDEIATVDVSGLNAIVPDEDGRDYLYSGGGRNIDPDLEIALDSVLSDLDRSGPDSDRILARLALFHLNTEYQAELRISILNRWKYERKCRKWHYGYVRQQSVFWTKIAMTGGFGLGCLTTLIPWTHDPGWLIAWITATTATLPMSLMSIFNYRARSFPTVSDIIREYQDAKREQRKQSDGSFG